MENRSNTTLFVRPAEGEGPLLPPQEQRPEKILERQAQPTQQAASPAQLGGNKRVLDIKLKEFCGLLEVLGLVNHTSTE